MVLEETERTKEDEGFFFLRRSSEASSTALHILRLPRVCLLTHSSDGEFDMEVFSLLEEVSLQATGHNFQVCKIATISVPETPFCTIWCAINEGRAGEQSENT